MRKYDTVHYIARLLSQQRYLAVNKFGLAFSKRREYDTDLPVVFKGFDLFQGVLPGFDLPDAFHGGLHDPLPLVRAGSIKALARGRLDSPIPVFPGSGQYMVFNLIF
jgi:hypothetical protein